MARNLFHLTNEVLRWIEPILPERDPFNTAIKMASELSELQHALHTGDGDVGEELADLLVLLLDAAHLTGVDLQAEFEMKMEVNRSRSWTPVMGCLKHQ